MLVLDKYLTFVLEIINTASLMNIGSLVSQLHQLSSPRLSNCPNVCTLATFAAALIPSSVNPNDYLDNDSLSEDNHLHPPA